MSSRRHHLPPLSGTPTISFGHSLRRGGRRVSKRGRWGNGKATKLAWRRVGETRCIEPGFAGLARRDGAGRCLQIPTPLMRHDSASARLSTSWTTRRHCALSTSTRQAMINLRRGRIPLSQFRPPSVLRPGVGGTSCSSPAPTPWWGAWQRPFLRRSATLSQSRMRFRCSSWSA